MQKDYQQYNDILKNPIQPIAKAAQQKEGTTSTAILSKQKTVGTFIKNESVHQFRH